MEDTNQESISQETKELNPLGVLQNRNLCLRIPLSLGQNWRRKLIVLQKNYYFLEKSNLDRFQTNLVLEDKTD